MSRRVLIVCAAVAAGAGVARGQFVLTDQFRRVYASASAANVFNNPPPLFVEEEFVAPDPGPFHGIAEVAAQGNVGAHGEALSDHVSSLDPAAIAVDGRLLAQANPGGMSTPAGASAEFETTIDFTVAEATPVGVTIELSAAILVGVYSPSAPATASVTLTRAGTVLVQGSVALPGPAFVSSEVLVLQPGAYTLEVLGASEVRGFLPSGGRHTETKIHVVLTATGCYADCTGDGVLTVADFGCFQTRFVAGDPYADCDGAGGLTVADFGCFQTRFVAGCP